MSLAPAPLVVTTSGKLHKRQDVEAAQAIAQRLRVPYVVRSRNAPLESLLTHAPAVLVVRGDGLVLLDAHGNFRWSPGMAHVRIKRLDDGVDQPDGVLVMGELRPGDAVLDCTLGLAQDALVMARAVGTGGRVVGLEKSLPLYAVVSEGLARHPPIPRSCRVEPIHADAADYLRAQPTGSFDCVFFDPMFGRPVRSQPAFEVLRRHAELAPLSRELLADAARVARRWVVVKAAPYSKDLEALGLKVEPFKRSADLRFGRLPGTAAQSSH